MTQGYNVGAPFDNIIINTSYPYNVIIFSIWPRLRCFFNFIFLINPLRRSVFVMNVLFRCRRSPWTLVGITIFIGTFRWNAYYMQCVYKSVRVFLETNSFLYITPHTKQRVPPPHVRMSMPFDPPWSPTDLYHYS